jgi:hypothetical protein
VAGADDRPPLLERAGVAYLRWRATSDGKDDDADDDVHVLNDKEQAKLRRIERGVVIRAAIAGALSALVCALAERWADETFGAAPDAFSFAFYAKYWGVVGGATAIASVFEIAYLYQDSLEGVHRLARASGLRLFDENQTKPAVAAALARAALELPNPLETPYRIDPHREVSKPRLLLATVLYKLKIGITSFLLKVVLRRIMSRAAVRVYLVFVAVPVTAIWNAVIAFRVIREARVRAMGPSAAQNLTQRLFDRHGMPSREGGVAALRAIGACVVSSFDLHPNHCVLLDAVHDRVGEPDGADLGDRAALLRDLPSLTAPEQRLVVSLLGVASILDARLTRRERQTFATARQTIGLSPDVSSLRTLRRAFAHGRKIDDAMLDALSV